MTAGPRRSPRRCGPSGRRARRPASARTPSPGRSSGPARPSPRCDVADEAGVVRGAQADVVREERRAEDVAVAVDGVDAPDHRDYACRSPSRPASRRRRARASRPAVACLFPPGHAPPPLSTEPMWYCPTSAGVIERDLRLRHLADLLLQRHAGEQLLDPALHLLVVAHAARDARPVGEPPERLGDPRAPVRAELRLAHDGLPVGPALRACERHNRRSGARDHGEPRHDAASVSSHGSSPVRCPTPRQESMPPTTEA